MKRFLLASLFLSLAGHASDFRSMLQPYLSKSLREFSDVRAGLAANLEYRFPTVRLGSDIEFYNSFEKYRRPGDAQMSFEDLFIYASLPELWKDTRWTVAATAGIYFPTSKTSQKSGLRFGSRTGVTLTSHEVFGDVFLDLRFYYMNHRFRTVDAIGSEPNTPLQMLQRVGLRLPVVKSVTFDASLQMLSAYYYQGRVRSFLGAQIGSSVQLGQDLTWDMSLTAQDRVVTTNSFLDNDTLSVLTGLTYLF